MLALLSLCAWIYLFFAHGAFWRSRPQLPAATPRDYPDVDIIVPARDEAETIQAAIGSLLAQEYGGNFRVILVDDNSSDDTASAGRVGCEACRSSAWHSKPAGLVRKTMGPARGNCGQPLAPRAADRCGHCAPPAHLATLVAKLQNAQLDLVSEMVRLNCSQPRGADARCRLSSISSKCCIPLPRSTTRGRAVAAAAGGTVLMRRTSA